MSKPFPALCRDCKHSKPEEHSESEWNLRCIHPIVIAKDPWALAGSGALRGSDCRLERDCRGLFAPCGIKGKLWEASPTTGE